MTPSLPSRRPALPALVDICGPGHARHARSTDTVAGRRATFVAAPATTTAVADLMALAAQRSLAVHPRGSGSKIDWGTPPAGADLVLETTRLNGLWNQAGDTVEVGAGTPVRALQAALALSGLRLPVDPPSPGATVGGLLATNESGPLRHRYGPPAAHVEAVTYVDRSGTAATSDGEDGRPGIAEIDGVLVSATVRLQALPTARRWVVMPVSTPLQVHNLVEETQAQGLTPGGIEVDLPIPTGSRTTEQPPGSLAVLLEGDRDDVDDRADRLARALGPTATGTPVAPGWWGRYPFDRSDVALRIAVGIADLHAAVYALSDACGGPVPIRGSAGIGVVHAVLPGSLPVERVRAVVDGVKQVLLGRGGKVAVLSAPPQIALGVGMASPADLS